MCLGVKMKDFSGVFDVTRVERKTAEYGVISSFVKKPAQNREKSTNGDYYCADLTELQNLLTFKS